MSFPSGAQFPSARLFPTALARDITLTVVLAPDRFHAAVHPDRFTLTIGASMPRNIDVSNGAVEYAVATLTEVAGADITGATLEVSLGSADGPGDWQAPDYVENPTDSTAIVKLLIGVSLLPDPRRYWLWVRVSDSPETVPVRANTPITIS